MLYPLTFAPIFKERVWGGRKLAELYRKRLPPQVPIGESWEITDRPGDISVITNGPLAGKDLHWLVEHHSQELLGRTRPAHGRFPLLIKMLDAEDKLLLFGDANPARPLLRERGHRAIGVVYHPEYEQFGNYVPTVLPRRYDAFMYLDDTEALHPLPVAPDEHEVPETYPTGV